MSLQHDHLARDAQTPLRIFYFSVNKLASEMSDDELDQEISSAESALAYCRETQSGFSTKESVRKRHCESERSLRKIEIANFGERRPRMSSSDVLAIIKNHIQPSL